MSKQKKKTFKAKFIHADCCNVTLADALDSKETFDVVSVQFALHYAFETEKRARKLMQNITGICC